MTPFTIRKHFIIHIFGMLIILVLTAGCQTNSKNVSQGEDAEPTSTETDAAKVTLLGVFHFGGSSGDLAAMHMADPFGKRRQDDIKELVAKIAEFQPTKILVEYPKNRQERLQERYKRYLSGEDTLGVNEIYQVGFRLAKELGHSRLYAIDHKMDLPAEELVAYCQRHGKMSEFETFIKNIRDYVARENKMLDTMSISAYLAGTNTDATDRITNQAYIDDALRWGDSISEAGARFAATWWERNFVILKNIAETIESDTDRILIIIGSGHRAVLKDLIIDRSDMEYVEAGAYLKE